MPMASVMIITYLFLIFNYLPLINLTWDLSIFFFFCFSGPHSEHMEVPRLGVQLELQLAAYATATATQDLSCACDLHHSSKQRQILNPLSKARDRTRNFMVPSQIHSCCATMGTPKRFVFSKNNAWFCWPLLLCY